MTDTIEPETPTEWMRVLAKLSARRITTVWSFCKKCGRGVRDYRVPDDVWSEIEEDIRFGNVLCYGCFADACRERGLTAVWTLEADQ